MNILQLEFDLSKTDAAGSDTDDLRQEISHLIDGALKRTGQGHWTACKIKGGILHVKCSVHEPSLARAQIKHALSRHWIIKHLLPRDKIG